MLYSLFAVHIGIQICLIAMVAVGGIFLHRHTGLCSAIWLSIYLAAGFILALFQPTLNKGWSEPLIQLWHRGDEFPWREASIGQVIASFSSALTLPPRVATLIVTVLVLADMAQLLDRLGIKSDSVVVSRLLSVHRHHSIWGATMLCFLILSPVSTLMLSYYVTSLVGDFSLSFP